MFILKRRLCVPLLGLIILFTLMGFLASNSLLNNYSLPVSLPLFEHYTTINKSNSVLADKRVNQSCLCEDEDKSWSSQLKLNAKLAVQDILVKNEKKKFLTIGIASVYRKEQYIIKTLKSFIQESDEDERKEALILIYLADKNITLRNMQRSLIEDNFDKHIRNNFIVIVESSLDFYPPMDFANKRRTFNDSQARVLWRAKQVIDFAFLFSCAQNLSHYYLVMEDDILAAYKYITGIKDFVKWRSKEAEWTALQFSQFLGIGLLFHSTDLPRIVELLILFYQQLPVDMLLRQFISLEVQDEKFQSKRIPSLFQHFGVSSTLPAKIQKIVDSSFDMLHRKFKLTNPPAAIITNMQVYDSFLPEFAYQPTPGFFWGITNSNNSPKYDINFHAPTNLSRIVILSGLKEKKKIKDRISNDSTLQVSYDLNVRVDESKNDKAKCTNFTSIGSFLLGTIDLNDNFFNVQCLRIRIGEEQKTWTIIKEIALFTL